MTYHHDDNTYYRASAFVDRYEAQLERLEQRKEAMLAVMRFHINGMIEQVVSFHPGELIDNKEFADRMERAKHNIPAELEEIIAEHIEEDIIHEFKQLWESKHQEWSREIENFCK